MVQYAHDIMDRVTNISWRTTSGATLGGFAYEYDALGRIVLRDHVLGDPSQSSQKTYTYDDFDRLATDGDVSYTYDAAGNRMTRTEAGETITYTLGVGDRLASWTGGAYTHDAAGNVTRIERDGSPTLDLAWNSQYQLGSVSTNGVLAESYTYDAFGRRVSTTTVEGTTWHVYDNNWQVIADIDENGNVVASYTWGDGIDRLLAVTIGGATYYPFTDIQGTVWGYVDSQNNVVARWQYDAWGNVVDEYVAPFATALASLRYRFQDREWSAATGLINFRMRWYDAETGRWLSKDPIGLSGGLNLYAFCENDSINYMDALGCCSAGEKAHKWAKKRKGSRSYNQWGFSGFPRWWGKYKCNLFVADAYNKGNDREIIPTGFWGTTPPRAHDWFDGNVPTGFSATETPQIGDVISDGSHMGIVSEPGKTSISASAIDGGVVENDWGFREGDKVKAWHYTK